MLSDKKINNFCRLYQKGNSMRDIGRKENVSPNTVKKYLLRNNILVKTQNIVYETKSDSKLLAGLYAGIWAGDGTQYYDKGYRIKICCNSKDTNLITYIQKVIFDLFGKKTSVAYEIRNRALIRYNSKFIYNYVSTYLSFSNNKTLSVCLVKKKHSSDFLNGFLLGLMLSDGYLKKRLYFNTISKKLSEDALFILRKHGFKPHWYIQKRSKYGWNDLYSVNMTVSESKKANTLLGQVLQQTGYNKGFHAIKGYGPAEI